MPVLLFYKMSILFLIHKKRTNRMGDSCRLQTIRKKAFIENISFWNGYLVWNTGFSLKKLYPILILCIVTSKCLKNPDDYMDYYCNMRKILLYLKYWKRRRRYRREEKLSCCFSPFSVAIRRKVWYNTEDVKYLTDA